MDTHGSGRATSSGTLKDPGDLATPLLNSDQRHIHSFDTSHSTQAQHAEYKVFGMPRRFFVIYLPMLVHSMCTEASGALGALVLFFTNARNWTNNNDVLAFAGMLALQSALPAICGPLLARLAVVMGPKRVTLACQVISLLALSASFLVRTCAAFIASVALTSLQGPALQPIRTLFIHHFVPSQTRTRFLSLVALVGVLGSLLSCLLMIMYAQFLDTPRAAQVLWSRRDASLEVTVDSSTATYLLAGALTAVNIVLSQVFLSEIPVGPGSPGQPNPRAGIKDELVSVSLYSESPSALKEVVLIFVTVVGWSSMTNGAVSVAVYPILVNQARFSQGEVAMLGIATTLAAVAPPAVMTIFPHVKDCTIMIYALLLQCLGAMLLSYANEFQWWAAVLGGLLSAHGTTYIFMASMNLFSLLISTHENQSALLRIPAFCQAMGLALGQLLGGVLLNYWYNSAWLFTAASPSLCVIVVLCLPWVRERLDPSYSLSWRRPHNHIPSRRSYSDDEINNNEDDAR